MMKMKKIAAIFMATVSVAAMAGCGSSVPANSVNSQADLEAGGKKIGVQLGTTGDVVNASDYEGMGCTVERFNKGADAIQALKQGKIDCVIIDSQPAQVFVSQNDDLKILDDTFEKEEYAIAIDKSNTEMMAKINAALEELKEDGTLDAIKKNWTGSDDELGKTPYVSPEGVDTSAGVLTMATNAEFPPYESREGDKVVGIDADIAQAIADKLGMELKIDDIAFDSVIPAVTSGKADIGIAGLTVTEDRLKNVAFSDTYAEATQVIIVRAK